MIALPDAPRWGACVNGYAMAEALVALGADPQTRVLATMTCAKLAVAECGRDHPLRRRLVAAAEVAFWWCDDRASLPEASLLLRAYASCGSTSEGRDRARHGCLLRSVCAALAGEPAAVSAASLAAVLMFDGDLHLREVARARMLAACADAIREVVPWERVAGLISAYRGTEGRGDDAE